jgi:hypothetical protein
MGDCPYLFAFAYNLTFFHFSFLRISDIQYWITDTNI